MKIHLFGMGLRNLEMPREMPPAKSPNGMSDGKNKNVSEPKQLVNAKAAQNAEELMVCPRGMGNMESKLISVIDSDPSEEIPLAARAAANRTATESVQPADPPPSSQPNPDTPPTIPTPSISHKKKGASHHKKGKGRNQYTKDRDNHDHDASPARSMSRDVTRNAEESGTSHAKTTGHEGGSKHGSKAKGGMNSRVTMTDMKRRANAILDYISRTQVELASDPLAEAKNSPGHGTTDDGSTNSAPRVAINGNGGNKKTDNATPLTNGSAASTGLSLKEFKDMSCVEMMDILARDLVKWQQEFAP